MGVQSVDEDFTVMFKWSMDIMFSNSKVWLYPVAVSLIDGLISAGMTWYMFWMGFPGLFLMPLLGMFQFLIGIALLIIVFFLTLMSVKMFIQVYEGGSVDFESAKDEILGNAGGYLIIGILAAILSIFIITIPLALLLITVSVVIGAGDIGRSFSLSVDILSKNLVPVILLSLISIILSFVVGMLSASPFFLAVVVFRPLSTFVNILILGAFTYLSLKALGYGSAGEGDSFE